MKHLIVCCDGTWKSEDDGQPSNVLKLYRRLALNDSAGNVQEHRYLPGVGVAQGGRWRKMVHRVFGGAFGWGLDANILEAYRWLIDKYSPGDRIWLFGFSRGAYTVRSVAGLIRNCGLLQSDDEILAKETMEIYRSRKPGARPDAPQAKAFRQQYSHEPEIHFLGVWDTVGALGVPSWLKISAALWNRRYQFHDVELSRRVRNAYQALAIDERRRAFEPAIWRDRTQTTDSTKRRLERREDVEQVWFVGSHTDVGGGYDDSRLSDLALEWMVDKVGKCGLAFNDPPQEPPFRPSAEGTLHDSRWWIHYVPFVSRRRDILPGNRQFIHRSAVVRAEAIGYAPPNFAAAKQAEFPFTPSTEDVLLAGQPLPVQEETHGNA